MNGFKNKLIALACVGLVLSGPVSLAAPAKKPATPPKVYTLKINPKSLQERLIRNNLPVLKGINNIFRAKDQVSIARTSLLPSLNLGFTSIATGGQGFAISAISFLFPFLLPSNWANLKKSKALLEAEKISYHLVGLNQYASAYAIYATVVNDLELREILLQQYNDLVKIRDWLIKQREFSGDVPQQDIDAADVQARLAFSTLSQMDALLIKERAALRELLALGPTDVMEFEPMHVPASPVESEDLVTVVKKVHAVSPENQQMQFLIAAGQAGKWSKVFSFMGGGNMNLSRSSDTSGWDKFSLGHSLNLGFGLVPNIKLSNDDLVQIQLQARELLLQQTNLVETTLGTLGESKKQLESNLIAKRGANDVFEAELRRYMLGLTDILHVLDAKIKYGQASAAHIRAQLDVDTIRITLHRAMLADQFKTIPKCVISAAAQKKDKGWFWKNLFNPKASQLTIDEACLPSRSVK
jgi:outer membrane protein, multidrug efflux system